MRIFDIIKNRNFNINSEIGEVLINNLDQIQIIFPNLNANEEVECIYYWYDHLTRGSQAVKDIETSLSTHNWELFE